MFSSSKTTTTDEGTTTTVTEPATKKTTTVAPRESRRSEGVTLALLGTGLLLLFAGTGRIKSVGFPGGLSLTLETGEEFEASIAALKTAVDKKEAGSHYGTCSIGEAPQGPRGTEGPEEWRLTRYAN